MEILLIIYGICYLITTILTIFAVFHMPAALTKEGIKEENRAFLEPMVPINPNFRLYVKIIFAGLNLVLALIIVVPAAITLNVLSVIYRLWKSAGWHNLIYKETE